MSAVLQQPIGASDENRPLFRTAFDTWAGELAPHHPEASPEDFAAYRERLFGGDFVFSVSRGAVRESTTPLLVLAGNDAHHPYETSREIASISPNVELVEPWWKEPERVGETVQRVRAFLKSHTPR